MNKEQRDIIIGGILGDASINKHGGITFVHSHKYTDYLQWKFYKLKSLNPTSITYHQRYDKRHNRIYKTGRFYIGKGQFKDLRQKFYPYGKKIIPSDLNITPLLFAIWFFDDGTCVKRSAFSLATNCFTQNDIKIAINALKQVGIMDCRQTKDKRIYIPAKNKERVISFVRPIIPLSMSHKIDVRPSLAGKIKVICPCNNTFSAYESSGQRYCNRECATLYRPSGYQKNIRLAICKRCKNKFSKYNTDFCSKCRGQRITPILCEICGKLVNKTKRVTCSKSCSVILGHRKR